jgi:GntP family gluconate:H+ symporter
MDSTWYTVSILLAGIVVVVGGILALRLHAFLALTFGALVVALLTPSASIENYHVQKSAAKVWFGAASDSRLELNGPNSFKPIDGQSYVVLRPPHGDASRFQPVAFLTDLRMSRPYSAPAPFGGGTVRWINEAEGSGDLRRSDELYLIPTADWRSAQKMDDQTIASRVAGGFGSTAAKIGILIAMASIIGKCLLDSGAADRIVRTALGWFGEKFAPVAFVLSGFLLGVPVFFDTVFYLMIPLGKAMQLRTGRNYLLFVLTIVAGATMAHSLVPPTPGPLIVAEQLGVDIGTMILAGCIIGLPCAAFGYFYASLFANKMWTLPLRESADFTMKDLEELTNRDESQLPPFWLSVLPIILPVFLIAGYSVLKAVVSKEWMAANPTFSDVAATLGDKNIALILSALIAMITLIRTCRTSRQELADAVSSALAGGGIIILITSAGGAFGKTLQETGVANLISDLPDTSPAMIITLAFLITAAIRTAQGSATVAMMTAVGILGGLAQSGNLPFHPVYLACAIGCGSKPIAWMNDSGFWVITRMSGMTEAEGLKYITPMTTLMGVVGLIVTIIGATLFPMAG